MNTNVIVTALLALVIVVFIFARQIIQRPVTQQSLLLPLILIMRRPKGRAAPAGAH